MPCLNGNWTNVTFFVFCSNALSFLQVSSLQTEAEATDAETSLPKGPWPVVGVVGVVGWVCRILSQEFWAKAKHLMRLGKTSRSVNTFGRIQNICLIRIISGHIWSNFLEENDEATKLSPRIFMADFWTNPAFTWKSHCIIGQTSR